MNHPYAFSRASLYAESKGLSVARLSSQWKRSSRSTAFHRPLDRVRVLEKTDETGHTGCVNALSWARDGELLLSGGDDTTVRMWRMDMTNSEEDYPWACTTVIHTGHRDNIFNAQMLPKSSRIVTVARDKQVRVTDVGVPTNPLAFNAETAYSSTQANVSVLRCHNRAVKRITSEHSPDLFLTVSEDGSVRQHDLRVPHNCRTQDCSSPLVQLDHSLSTLALSPLTPYQFVVAGESQYGYLFDRRHTGRRIPQEWGMPLDNHSVTTCVRRFGRSTRGPGETTGFEHITSARMASENGHEVLLSYSSDAIYLYSTLDSPSAPSSSSNMVAMLSPNSESKSSTPNNDSRDGSAFRRAMLDRMDVMTEDGIDDFMTGSAGYLDEDMERDQIEDSVDFMEYDGDEVDPADPFASTPIVLPQRQFSGHCNVETVKDVNFLGPEDEFVVSGSDDGNWFIWDKKTGKLHDILEGDSSVVNVIEGHPHLPLIAVSGIDTTVKLFGPAQGASVFSRLQAASSITTRNADASSHRVDLAAVATYARIAELIGGANSEELPCTTQ